MIYHGDCIEVMRTLPADSVDAVCTDPPYGLGFMGKDWDNAAAMASIPKGGVKDRPGGPFAGTRVGKGPAAVAFDGIAFQAWCTEWGREALRVTKPGGYLLAFGGTRTHHRLVCGLEDAGWIIRDELDWIYASGFPKGKANLKPAHEPIVLARKTGPLRPLAIDACRITWAGPDDAAAAAAAAVGFSKSMAAGNSAEQVSFPTNYDKPLYEPDKMQGRWPSNLLLSDPELFDQPNPEVVGSGAVSLSGIAVERNGGGGKIFGADRTMEAREDWGYGDSGGYARFFIVPKSARGDREPVLRGQLDAKDDDVDGTFGLDEARPHTKPDYHQRKARENAHPTVKPTDLMRHLVRLVTPSGGTVLDPFLGSGSTAIACELEGFPWIGIEKEAEYVAIAEARLNGVQRGLGLDVPAPTRLPSRTGQQGPTPETNGQARWTEWREDSESPEDDAA